MSALASALVIGQLVGLAPAGFTSTLSLGDRTEIRLRSVQGGPAALDVENTANSTLLFNGRRQNFVLAYTPRFSYFDVTGAGDTTLMSAGHAGASFWTRRFRLTLSLDGSFGTQSTAGLAPALAPGAAPATGAGPPVVVFLSPQTKLYSASARAGVGTDYKFSHRWNGGVNGYFTIAGGLDFGSQAVLPPSRTGGGDVQGTYAATHLDRLTTRVRGSDTIVLKTPVIAGAPPNPNGGNFMTLELTEAWAHSFSLRTQGAVQGGISYLHGPGQKGTAASGGFSATGYASLAETTPLHDDATLTTSGSAGAATAYNPVVGEVQRYVAALIASSWVRRRLGFNVSAAATASLPWNAPNQFRSVSGTAFTSYAFGTKVQLSVGVRASTQILPPRVAQNVPPQWVGFVAVSLFAPPIPF